MIRRFPLVCALAAVALAGLCAGCAKPPAASTSAPPARGGKVGYVRMDELIKDHPLYPQLAQTERSIDALNLRSLGPGAAETGADLAKQDAELQRELNDASARAKKLLDQKQDEYRKQENAAIAAALSAGGHPAPQLAQSMNGDMLSLEKTLQAQDRAQVNAFARSATQRADRQYRAKANELQQKESQFSLELASKDAPARLELRTRLANLAMDDATREQVRKQLSDLDRKEADQVAAMRNRDQATLVQLRDQLRGSTQREIGTTVAKIHADTQAKLSARAAAQQKSLTAQAGPLAAGGSVPPDLKAKIEALHKEYQQRFDQDAKATIEQFNKTRDELKRRYDALHGVEGEADAATRKELAALQAQHDKLYAEIVDQVDREVRTVAQNRGVSVVLSTIAAGGQGIDLTSDAKKEIESLHE
ncbi:MAG: hypothetical protein JO101_05560 [Candidatus Eremiobacteraeota bacterium]|nr:hypothetical protein [Candidatus Eremiobacteraeota bacterium]